MLDRLPPIDTSAESGSSEGHSSDGGPADAGADPSSEGPAAPQVDLGGLLQIKDIVALAEQRSMPVFSLETLERMQAASDQLAAMIARGDQIYGVTTGFGPLARYQLPDSEIDTVQRNLVYHLASGVGPAFDARTTRAIMACRLSTLAQGFSGITVESAELLRAFLLHNLNPVIPCRGTVGASGDLTPLAHIALAMLGEGQLFQKDAATPVPAAEHMAAYGLKPMRLQGKDALALVNGTAAMTGVAALNGVDMGRAITLQEMLSAIDVIVSDAPLEAYHPHLATIRPHAGQLETAHRMHALLRADEKTVDVETAAGAYGLAEHPHQEEYTLRCVLQELGAARDVLAFHNETVTTEINAVTDNPVLCPAEDRVLHGGNFYGQHVAYASDALMTAVVKLAVFAERVTARLCNPARSKGLPPFLTPEKPGIHSGLMGAQVTATALVAEMRSNAVPASIQSISTNSDNQDVVTMGTIAARKAASQQELMWDVMAIEALALMQAVDLRGCKHKLTPPLTALYDAVRKVSANITTDRPLDKDISAVSALLKSSGE